MKTIAAAVFASVLVSACACTEIGCETDIRFSLASLVDWAGTESFTVEVCTDGECATETLDPEKADKLRANNSGDVSFFLPANTNVGTISISMTTNGGELKADGSGLAFETRRPNGAFCDPVCHSTRVKIEDGTVVNQ